MRSFAAEQGASGSVPRILLVGDANDRAPCCDLFTRHGGVVFAWTGGLVPDGVVATAHSFQADVIVVVLVALLADAALEFVSGITANTDVPIVVQGRWRDPGFGISMLAAGACGVALDADTLAELACGRDLNAISDSDMF